MTLLVLALAYIVGLYGGSILLRAGQVDCDFPTWLWIVPLAVLPLTALLNRVGAMEKGPLRWPESAGFVRPQRGVMPGMVVAVLLCLAMGGLRMISVPSAGCWREVDLAAWNLPSQLSFDDDAPQVSVVGYVSNFPTVKEGRQEIVVTVSRLLQEGRLYELQGRARLVTNARPLYSYGQPVEVTGRMATPPDFADFSYREWLARQGIHSHFYDAKLVVLGDANEGVLWKRWLYGVRSRAMSIVEQMLPEPHAALAEGILLGVDAGIPDELYDRFNATSTSHVLVISGANVALIVALILGISQRLVGRWATVVALVAIAAYVVLVGAEVSVLRAAFMGGLVVLAASVGRRSAALISLAVACWVMLLVNPQTLYDAGFQLSVAATLGLILFATGIMEWLSRRWPALQGGMLTRAAEGDRNMGALVGGIVIEGGVMTVAATILTLPLVAYHFERVSLLGVLVNLLIVPVQPLILIAGTLGVIGGMVGLNLVAQPLLWVAWLGLEWTMQLVNWAAMLPATSIEVAHFGVGALIASYALIALIYVATTHISKGADKGNVKIEETRPFLNPGLMTSPGGLGVLALLAVLIWAAVMTLPDGRLHLYFLDIGQGDGILIQTPNGRQLLIDGGASPEQLLSQLGEVIPWWDRSLDLVMATHADRDHIAAQEAIPDRYQVAMALESTAMLVDPEAEAWRDELVEEEVEFAVQHGGGWVDLGDGVALWVLWPPQTPLVGENASNENSLVAKLVYGDVSVLLTGDAGIPSESTWLDQGVPLAATILKVGHHGSKTSSSTTFVDAVDPHWAVIQVGAENNYGHPAPEVLTALAGRTILRNDEDGRIHFATDGSDVWIETER